MGPRGDRRGGRAGLRGAAAKARSAPTSCRPPSPPCTTKRRASRRPTGRRSWRCNGLLVRMSDNPMVALNHAIATAMVHGPAAGLALLDARRRRAPGRPPPPGRRPRPPAGTGRRPIAAAAACYARAADATASLPERNYLLARAMRLNRTSRADFPSGLFVALEDVDEFGAVLFAGLRERPATDDLADTGVDGAELRGAFDGHVLHAPRDPDVHLHRDLPVRQAVVAQERPLVAVLDPAAVVVDDARDLPLRGRRAGADGPALMFRLWVSRYFEFVSSAGAAGVAATAPALGDAAAVADEPPPPARAREPGWNGRPLVGAGSGGRATGATGGGAARGGAGMFGCRRPRPEGRRCRLGRAGAAA